MISLALFACLLSAALAASVDLSTYPLSAVLRDRDSEVYTLHWSFDTEAKTIRFAVNVSTTGWVGLGLSPTGGMPNSDVVIGWVNDDGEAFLQDRFAFSMSLPPVDPEQNWSLDGGMEMDGFTILAFSRDWVTCDDLDREIKADTTRVIYSWNEVDPANDDPNAVIPHGTENRGTLSLNLLGGQQEVPPDPADLESFDVIVENVTVPNGDTTYWCYVGEVPQSIQNQRRYITKATPVITPGNEAHVHHMLVYECDSLNEAHVGYSAPCGSGGTVGSMVAQCRQGTLLVGWAIGGEEFVYPADVAYPIGGPGAPRYIVMETHYDNPDVLSGIVDNSGMRFSYTSTAREFDAGILQLGHQVTRFMIIPPGPTDYVVQGECSSDCTASQIPDGGINIFANILHTHLVGVGLTLQHIRRTQTCQNNYEELPPIDQNQQYDFNYQQATYLPQIINVQPGDILRLECTYNTAHRDGVVLGGDSTVEEMCLSFLFYYPRIDLAACLTNTPPVAGSYQPFLTDFVTDDQRDAILETAFGSRSDFENALNAVNWSPQASDSFQSSITNGPRVDNCIPQSSAATSVTYNTGLPAIQCPYQPSDPCSDTTQLPGDGAVKMAASVSVIVIVCLITLAM